MLWLILIIIGVICAYLYSVKQYKYWDERGVKISFQFPPFLDSFRQLLNLCSLYEIVLEKYNSFPKERFVGIFQFNSPALMIRDTELIKQICVKDFDFFLDHSPAFPIDAEPLLGKNLFFLRGQKWKNMRSTLSPAFTGSKMRLMFELMHECSEDFSKYFSENPDEIVEVELKDCFTRFTNDVIASTAFGIKCDSLREKNNEFYLNGLKSTDFTGLWRTIKFLIFITVPKLGKLLGIAFFPEDVKTFFRGIIRDTVEYREKNKVERPDMINLLMHARKGTQKEEKEEIIKENNYAAVDEQLEVSNVKPKIEITLDDITSQALIFFFAGFETVATAMCFVAYELAVNPDIQQKLIDELDEFRANNKTLTYEGLSKLPYLDMVFSETLRKWPPNVATDRKCLRPYTIKPENPEEKPLELKYNDTIFIPIFAIHRDPKYWENPEKFDPERFSPENKEKIVPYSYMPFGAGPRLCIASRFAISEVKAVIFGLLEKFEIVPTAKSTIPYKQNKRAFNLSPENGFWFGLKKRQFSK